MGRACEGKIKGGFQSVYGGGITATGPGWKQAFVSGKEQLKNSYTQSQWEVGRANKIKYPEQIVLGKLAEK